MKRLIVSTLTLALALLWASGISPYVKVATYDGPMNIAVGTVSSLLEEAGYQIIGQYHPGDKPGLYVLVFTSNDLKAFCRKSEDRGMLAAAMKIGFQQQGEKIAVSVVNPEYLFHAYFREKMNEPAFKGEALSHASKLMAVLKEEGVQEPFGGDLDAEKLQNYRYMAGMPNFEKAVVLAEFDSFKEGLAAIRDGLSREKSTRKVYEIVSETGQTAVFGIGLMDKEKGEAHFLPIIGEDHVAALPYELVLQGNKVSMLHGRYRFALHWPELTMKTFTKIMSSPGDVEDAMLGLFETD